MGVLAAVTDPRFGQVVSIFAINDQGVADLDPNFNMVSGNQAVAQSVAIYWLSPRGTLITNPDAGMDLRTYLNAEFDASSQASVFQLREALIHEALRDERIDTIDVDVSFDPADPTNQTLKISARIHLADPDLNPFVFVLSISAVTTQLIMSEAA